VANKQVDKQTKVQTEAQAHNPYQQIFTPANIVTMLRIAFVPAFVVLILAPWPSWVPDISASSALQMVKPLIAAIIFALLAFSDSVDGYLARSRNEVTTLGKFLDPLADKILVTAALLALVELGDLPAWIALVIIAREFLVSGLRMVASVEGFVIAASPLGKIKTVLQIVALLLFIVKGSTFVSTFVGSWMWLVNTVSWFVMAVALLFTLLSLVDYFMKSSEVLGLPLNGSQGILGIPSRLAAGRNGTKGGSAAAVVAVAETPQTFETSEISQVTEAARFTEAAQVAEAARVTEAAQVTEATRVIECARAQGRTLGTAESCTGGLVAAALTEVPGASEVFCGTVVSYANEVKASMLDVSSDVIKSEGAVSAQVVEAMARGALVALDVSLSVSVTGIAGPTGGSKEKPVGTVWFGLAQRSGGEVAACSEVHHFSGTRSEVRAQATTQALKILAKKLCERD
jgi:CDP-diacylglycerol--glycerol-3-phosphate 3-phosphatidyltransferase